MAIAPNHWLFVRPIAHRGLHAAGVPENSLAAFERAISRGMPFELDVQRTADGQLVIFHDAVLDRLTGSSGSIAEKPLADLKMLRLSGSSQSIPTLSEVFALCRGRVPILIELKNEGKVGPLEDAVLAEIARYDGQVAIESFNPFSVLHIRRKAPHILRGQLSGDFRDRRDIRGLKRYVLRKMLLNLFTRPHFVAYDVTALSIRGLKKLKRRCGRRPLLLWTVRNREQYQIARKFGCNVIFENIEPD